MFSKKKYTEDEMQEAINRNTDLGYQLGLAKGKLLGYLQGLREVNANIDANSYGIDTHGQALGLTPDVTFTAKEFEGLMRIKEARGKGL